MKGKRIKMLEDCLFELGEAKKIYREASPAWTLIRAAEGFIKSIYHLESDNNFSSETLGVKTDEK